MVRHRFAGWGKVEAFAHGITGLRLMTLAGLLLCCSVAHAGFAPAAPMNSARAQHTATRLESGKVLVVGGYGTSGMLGRAELYDPATETWSPAGNLTTPRYGHTATLLASGKVLVVGGYGNGGTLTSVEIYDPVNNVWSSWGQVPWMSLARDFHSATLLSNGELLIAGGWGYDPGTGREGALPYASTYVPSTNSWMFAGTLRERRTAHDAVRMDSGEVLVVGGANGSTLASSELYDPASRSWRSTAPMAIARSAPRIVKLGSGKVLATGGNGMGAAVAGCEVFDPAKGEWSAGGSLSQPHTDHTATALPGGGVLVVGGIDGANAVAFAAAELYDPVANEWKPAGNLATGRHLHTATLLPSGKVLVVGGREFAVGLLSSAELFDQDTRLSISGVAPASTVTGQPYQVSVVVTTATGAAQGSVMVSDGRGATCGPVVLQSGSGSCSLASHEAGGFVLSATFTPDSGAFAPSSANTVHAVNRADTTLAIVAHSPGRTAPGQPVTIATTLSVASPGVGAPTGAISVGDGINACTIPEGGSSCSLSLTTRGPRTLVATYGGDASYIDSSVQVVHLVNRLPETGNAAFSGYENLPRSVSAEQGLLAGATDPDGDTLAIAIPGPQVASGIGGTVVLDADGSFTYTPPAATSGTATFTYRLGDGYETVDATATIVVAAVNHAPSFTLAKNPAWPAGASGARQHAGFAQVTSFGSPEEGGQQVLDWHLRPIADPDGVVANVQVALDGTLSYVLTGRTGAASFGLRVQDDGGTANGGHDTSPEQTFSIGVARGLDLSVALDAGVDFIAGGGRLEYLIVVRNAGPDATSGAVVRDLLPSNLVDAQWNCAAEPGASCTAAGSGDIADSVVIPAGGGVAYRLEATVVADPEHTVVNAVTVTATAATPDIDEANNTSTALTTVGIFADGYDRTLPH